MTSVAQNDNHTARTPRKKPAEPNAPFHREIEHREIKQRHAKQRHAKQRDVEQRATENRANDAHYRRGFA